MAKKINSQQNLIFRNVRIRYLDMRRNKEGPPFLRAHLAADLSDPIRDALGWSVGHGQESGKFAGSVVATSMIFTPNQKHLDGMGADEVQMECTDLSDFSFTERRDKDGTSKGVDLLFIVRSSDLDAEAKLGGYWRAVMAGDSQLKIVYTSIGRSASGDPEPAEAD